MHRAIVPALLPAALIAATATATVVTPAPVQATGLEVTTLADSGDGSLRAVLEAANETSEPDTITFAAGLNGTVELESPLPEITRDLTIDGDHMIVVDANGTGRVLEVGTHASVTVSALMLTGGTADRGAGIYSAGTLTVTDSILSGNAVTSDDEAHGGAIYSEWGATTIIGTEISGNTASAPNRAQGGAIVGAGTLTITDSAITNNSASSEDLVRGGAIYQTGPATITRTEISGNRADGLQVSGGALNLCCRDVTISDSAISGNTANAETTASGGGITAGDGNLSIISSSVTGNTASGSDTRGGGIWTSWAPTTVLNSTVSGNSAGLGSAIYATANSTSVTFRLAHSTVAANLSAADGSAIRFVDDLSGVLASSIVAGNLGGSDCSRSTPVAAEGLNLVGDGSCGVDGALAGDARLGPLADNGGRTLTHTLRAGSPAIDAIDPADCPETDQRGAARPQGASCDLGAVEWINTAPNATDDAFSVQEEGALTVAAPGLLGNDTDPDEGPLTAELVTAPAHGTVTVNGDGSFRYQATRGHTGTDQFTYQVSDGQLTSPPATVTITVTPFAPPRARADTYRVREAAVLTVPGPGVLGNDRDADGHRLTAELVTRPARGTVTLHGNGSFRYQAARGYSGRVTFTYRASDGRRSSAPTTVAITVTPLPLCQGRKATIVGTARADTIRGTSGADVIVAGTGNDIITGRGGNDLICAGGGNDVVRGNAGHDRLHGQAGADRLLGGPGNDTLDGGPGRDQLAGGPGRNRIVGAPR